MTTRDRIIYENRMRLFLEAWNAIPAAIAKLERHAHSEQVGFRYIAITRGPKNTETIPTGQRPKRCLRCRRIWLTKGARICPDCAAVNARLGIRAEHSPGEWREGSASGTCRNGLERFTARRSQE